MSAPKPIHYNGPNSRIAHNGRPICGAFWYRSSWNPPPPDSSTSNKSLVTCRRCIASMRADGLLPEPSSTAG